MKGVGVSGLVFRGNLRGFGFRVEGLGFEDVFCVPSCPKSSQNYIHALNPGFNKQECVFVSVFPARNLSDLSFGLAHGRVC